MLLLAKRTIEVLRRCLFGGEVGLGAEVEAIAAGEEGDRESGDVGKVVFHEVGWVGLG